MYAAGVLPISWISGRLYFLVGKDARDDSWSDFAGKCEKVDKDIESTAAREFWEESYGILMDARTMRQRLTPQTSFVLRGKTQNAHPFYCFVTEVPFFPHARDAFRKHLLFLRQRNVHRIYVEKTDIVYVSLGDLVSDQFPKRSVFKDTVLQNRHVLESLERAGAEGFASFCADFARVPNADTKSSPNANGPERRHLGAA